MYPEWFIIILTAFAVFGRYSLAVMIAASGVKKHYPPSVTIMRCDSYEKAMDKISLVRNNIPDNSLIIIPDESVYHNCCNPEKLCGFCEICVQVTRRLFTKNAD
ncbi:MAG: hypothetical protein IKU54_04575 [Oscillospiraceae bacterium]|nr:hypothetical protein [Oscillospiraceae bacterium]